MLHSLHLDLSDRLEYIDDYLCYMGYTLIILIKRTANFAYTWKRGQSFIQYKNKTLLNISFIIYIKA
jgi:hypothetical protein